MTEQERQELEKEWSEIVERCKGQFVDPKDIRRKEEITSLLMTDGQSKDIKFNFVKGRKVTQGMNTKGYNRKGPVG